MSELQHHGIMGMKWGVRRFQNPDGSLTPAGEKRYSGKKEYEDSVARKLLTGNNRFGSLTFQKGGTKGNRERRADKLERKAEEASKQGNDKKAEKFKMKAEAQKTVNANREAYDRHTSTGKIFVQNLLMTAYGAERYRNARASGESRGRAYLEAYLLAPQNSKKPYDAAAWSESGGDTFE